MSTIIEESLPAQEVHMHSSKVYAVQDKNNNTLLLCEDCHPKELTGGNECFCQCHKQRRLSCRKCIRLHEPAGLQ